MLQPVAPGPEVASREGQPIPETVDPRIEALVHDIIGKVADKWTMMILDALHEDGTLRFTQLGRKIGGISQKMLTQTVRQMEKDGLVSRTVHPVIPPRVDYSLTPLGETLGAAFCGVWIWAEAHYAEVEQARARFAARNGRGPDRPPRTAGPSIATAGRNRSRRAGPAAAGPQASDI